MYNFEEISDCPDAKLVDTCSELRHFINIWGITDKLMLRFKTTYETLAEVYEYCRGELLVRDAINNIDEIKEEYEERQEAINEAAIKNEDLIFQLYEAKKSFCNNCGLRKIKTRLTKKINKENDLIAKLFRLALEAETVNILAKHDNINYYPGQFFNHTVKEMLYFKKTQLIKEMMKLCKDNNIVYGIQYSDNYSASYIVYFELPNTKQISFHTNFEESTTDYPKYKKEWDGLVNSTLPKLEEGIMATYPDIIK